MVNRVTNLIQLALRAGKIAKGDGLIPSIQAKKAKCVIVASSCGENRKKKLHDKCSYYSVPLFVVEDAILDDVSSKKMSAIAIVDNGFAKAIIQYMKG